MDAKSKERTATRWQFTRTANIFESLTTNKNNNKIDIIESFKSYYDSLKVLDNEVRTFLFQEPEKEDYEEAGNCRPYVKLSTKQLWRTRAVREAKVRKATNSQRWS